MKRIELLILLTLIGIAIGVPTHFWRKDKARLEKAWGSNPGYIEHTTQYETEIITRRVLVRDLNDTQEVQQKVKASAHSVVLNILWHSGMNRAQIDKEFEKIKVEILNKEKLKNYPYLYVSRGVGNGVWLKRPSSYPNDLTLQIGVLVLVLVMPYLVFLTYRRG